MHEVPPDFFATAQIDEAEFFNEVDDLEEYSEADFIDDYY